MAELAQPAEPGETETQPQAQAPGDPNPPVTADELTGLRWRTSTFSPGAQGRSADCLEVARLPDGRTAVRNRNRPEAGAVVFTPAEMDAWIKGCKAGEFDDIGDETGDGP